MDMEEARDLNDKSFDELVKIKRHLEEEISRARNIVAFLPYQSFLAPDEKIRGLFDEVNQYGPVCLFPPSTVFAGWRNSVWTVYSYFRADLLLYAAKKTGIKLTEQLNEIYKRNNKPLLKDWVDVIDKYIDRAAVRPIPVEWLEEAETCWEEFHHWLKTCPTDEHPMRIPVEKRNEEFWQVKPEEGSAKSESDEPRDEYL